MKVRVILLIAIGFFYQTLSIYIQCLFSDGLLVTCGYDYLTDDWNHKSYLLYAFCLNYAFPMLTVIFFYSQVLYMYYLPCKRLKFKMEQQPLSKATAMSVHFRKNLTVMLTVKVMPTVTTTLTMIMTMLTVMVMAKTKHKENCC